MEINTKDILRKYIDNQFHDVKVDIAMGLMEARAELILKDSKYDEMYIDPKVDILNSDPQVIQQVKEELQGFLNLLLDNKVKNLLQIGLGHWASTHFVLSLLIDQVTTVEYDEEHVKRYIAHASPQHEKIITGDSLEAYKDMEDNTFDAVFIDANHSYEYVKKDLENYYKKVKIGGIIALHDVNFEGDRYGIPRVLRESTANWIKISYSDEVGIAYTIKE